MTTLTHTREANGHTMPMPRPAAPAGKSMPSWGRNGIRVLRIAFGVVWAIHAWFKWQPRFNKFTHRHNDHGSATPTLMPSVMPALMPTPTAMPTPTPMPLPLPSKTVEDPAALAEKAMPPWRRNGIGVLRIAFGVVWAVDAWFKWQPSFIKGFTDYLTSAKDGQPQLIKDWIDFWVKIVNIDPHVFAHAVAIGETAVAVALILGAFSNLTYIIGGLLTVVIWTTAEGFGGPYAAGSTDIGAGIMYPIVFVGLFLASAGLYLGVDSKLRTKVSRRFRWITSS